MTQKRITGWRGTLPSVLVQEIEETDMEEFDEGSVGFDVVASPVDVGQLVEDLITLSDTPGGIEMLRDEIESNPRGSFLPAELKLREV